MHARRNLRCGYFRREILLVVYLIYNNAVGGTVDHTCIEVRNTFDNVLNIRTFGMSIIVAYADNFIRALLLDGDSVRRTDTCVVGKT